MSGCTHTLLDNTDLTLNFGYMFVGGGSVELYTGGSEVMLHGNKLAVHKHCCYFEAASLIDGFNMSGGREDLWELSIFELLGGCKLDVVANSGKERDTVNEEDVAR